ncbi:hypothetical protein [Sphingomonas sp. KC8]|uniref:hypothetical protein n=1 Tax=Sphingomonas sp. KC8 TaxID=1030157 RepID=UPI0002F29353|nr:hypothetical protein [Sphingomonas sp. KC8]ARS28797.1 hypothetical protein KC8_16085 [Sphingomonas sp. KC8]
MGTFAKSIVLAGLLVGGCAGPPRQAVATSGALPAGAGWSFILQPDDSALLAALEPQVRQCFVDIGAAPGQKDPAYIVQWSFADRPGGANVFVHDDAPSAQIPGVWADGKGSGRRGRALVTIGVIDAANAQQVYRVSATEHHGRKADPARAARLVEAACNAMRGQ